MEAQGSKGRLLNLSQGSLHRKIDDSKNIIHSPPELSQEIGKASLSTSKKLPVQDSQEEDDEDYSHDGDDSADIEHDFDNDENEEALLKRLEKLGDSGRNKHKTFEGIPKQWHQTIRVKNPET